MARTKPPSFDFFPDDFIAGTYHLPAEAVGIYVRLLCFQWNNGSIPNDEAQLSRIAGVDADAMRTHMQTVMLKFMHDECGGLKNLRLERERDHKLAIIEKSKSAADIRWAKEKARKDAELAAKLAPGGNADAHADAHADALRTDMPPTSNVQLPTSKENSNINSTGIKHIECLAEGVFCPEWLKPDFCRWLAYREAIDGRKVPYQLQEQWAFELNSRGPDKALADIAFSISKQAKNLCKTENDFQELFKKRMESVASSTGQSARGSKGNRLRAAEELRKAIEEDRQNGQ